jgi:hypothetical protein
VDTTDLARAFDEFLLEAAAGGFKQSPDRILATVLAVTAHIAGTALAIQAGLRVAYDNRSTQDVANLRRLARGNDLVARVRAGGEVFRAVAGQLTDDDLAVSVPVLILERDEIVVDEPLPLLWLVTRVAEQHLPTHTQLLRDLRL